MSQHPAELQTESVDGNSLSTNSSCRDMMKGIIKGLDHAELSTGNLGKLARQSLEGAARRPRKKQYGQFFTPDSISALACAASISSQTTTVLDPMCGTGAMLWAASDRLSYLSMTEPVRLIGVEVDPLLACIASSPPDEVHVGNAYTPEVVCGDAFLDLTGISSQAALHSRYDAVIGNPPYVRYQNVARMYRETNPLELQIFREALAPASDPIVIDTLLRSSLITHLVADPAPDARERARQVIAMLRSPVPPGGMSPLDTCWLNIVSKYSGLSDLSLPAWLLTWLLAKPGAVIAYVTTSSWKSREYARILRYFMHRMLQPLLILEQDMNWFENALVPTSLMVFRVRAAEEASVPLQDRSKTDHVVRTVRIHRNSNLADPDVLLSLAQDLGLKSSLDPACRLVASADAIITAVSSTEQDVENDLWAIQLVPESAIVDALFYEDAHAHAHKPSSSAWTLEQLDNPRKISTHSRSSYDVPPHYGPALPPAISQTLGITDPPSGTFCLLNDYGISVNQGLRTGCNPFFYVRSMEAEEIAQLLPEDDPSDVMSCFASPNERPDYFSALVLRLHSKGIITPDEQPSECPSSVLVKLDEELGVGYGLLPDFFLKPVVRNQRSLRGWTVSQPSQPVDRTIVSGSAATPEDYEALSVYPHYWLQMWKERDRLSILPSALAKYIRDIAVKTVERNGRQARIPDLTAVSSNIRHPAPPPASRIEQGSFLKNCTVPPIPSWWYTLTITPRHRAPVFMARVNSGSPRASLNSLDIPVLIDANFSTFSMGNDEVPVEALFAVLNSLWVSTMLELIGTPMGGGALKVEAAHLRRLSLPMLSADVLEQLCRAGSNLAESTQLDDISRISQSIDEIVNKQLATRLQLDRSDVGANLIALRDDMLQRRRRK